MSEFLKTTVVNKVSKPSKVSHVKVVRIRGESYLVHSRPVGQLAIQNFTSLGPLSVNGGTELIPCTVIELAEDERLCNDVLDHKLKHLALLDDVWSSKFEDVILVQSLRDSKIELQHQRRVLFNGASSKALTNGPYMLSPVNGETFAVWKLLKDHYSAFIQGAVEMKPQSMGFLWLDIEGIAIPSRFYSKDGNARPLAGLRFAVKDIIDVEGLETGCGNRAYREFYPPRTASALCVRRLIDGGAICVGKTKTTQFAEGQVPLQWFDYLAPYNPRGDSYQMPSSSSTGSAVAVAAYPWLDFSIATDTGGSIRHPAGVCGTYGMRASSHAISTSGIYSVSPYMDSVGFFARSAYILELVMKTVVEPSFISQPPLMPQAKFNLLYPVRAKGPNSKDSRKWFPYPGEPGDAVDVEDLFENTVQKMESHLGCQRSIFNLDDLWRDNRPVNQSESLDKATGKIYTILSTYSCVRETIDPFISDFKASNNGRAPFIDPIVKTRHQRGRQATLSEYEAAMESAEMFSQWIRNTIFARTEQNEFPLLVFPQSWGSPHSRTDPDDGPAFFNSFSTYSLSYLSGCPDCTVPIGEVSHKSIHTGADILLPVSLSFLSPPGTDLTLLALLSDLESCEILRPVKTGPSMYTD